MRKGTTDVLVKWLLTEFWIWIFKKFDKKEKGLVYPLVSVSSNVMNDYSDVLDVYLLLDVHWEPLPKKSLSVVVHSVHHPLCKVLFYSTGQLVKWEKRVMKFRDEPAAAAEKHCWNEVFFPTAEHGNLDSMCVHFSDRGSAETTTLLFIYPNLTETGNKRLLFSSWCGRQEVWQRHRYGSVAFSKEAAINEKRAEECKESIFYSLKPELQR